jgi:hypothetical protein
MLNRIFFAPPVGFLPVASSAARVVNVFHPSGGDQSYPDGKITCLTASRHHPSGAARSCRLPGGGRAPGFYRPSRGSPAPRPHDLTPPPALWYPIGALAPARTRGVAVPGQNQGFSLPKIGHSPISSLLKKYYKKRTLSRNRDESPAGLQNPLMIYGKN